MSQLEEKKQNSTQSSPEGELAIRVVAMPAYTNPNGDIFGGWVVSQMDLAGMVYAKRYTQHKVVTVAINSMAFLAPVSVGDCVCCYVRKIKTGRTSLTLQIETWAMAPNAAARRKVTEGTFVYVAVDVSGKSVGLC